MVLFERVGCFPVYLRVDSDLNVGATASEPMADFVYRHRSGKGFTYRYKNGRTVRSGAIRRWVGTLVIPPAWTDVEVALDRDAKILATGRDGCGRKQYLYNPDWTSRAAHDKFNRILRFAEQLHVMRRVTGQHIRRRPIDEKTVLACMTRMLDEAFFRPGNETYARNNHTYGLTTLRQKHLSIENGIIIFDYVGKSHQEQHQVITDRLTKEALVELNAMPGRELFDVTLPDGNRKKITSQDLNQYIANVMGENFSAKDFRTWAGTVLMATALDELGPAENARAGRKNVLNSVKSVAAELGNTPTVCRDNYIHPQVFAHYEAGSTLAHFRRQLKCRSSRYMSRNEKATLELLKCIAGDSQSCERLGGHKRSLG